MSARGKKRNITVPILKEGETEAGCEFEILSNQSGLELDSLTNLSKSQHTQDKTRLPRSAWEGSRTPVCKGSRCQEK